MILKSSQSIPPKYTSIQKVSPYVSFRHRGHYERITSPVWVLLEACIKEALTNVRKHSNSKEVDIELVVTDHLIRLKIQDYGNVQKHSQHGTGIRSLQLRARTLKGTLSVDRTDGYRLVCVLPIDREIN